MMRVAKKQAAFALMTPPFLARLAKEFPKGKGSIAERICETILRDLDRFCALNKKLGEQKVRSMRIPHTTYEWILDGPCAGTYAGFGLGGKEWLNLGFLEEPVVETFRKKFEAMRTASVAARPSSQVDTMLGSVCCDHWIYPTSQGTFSLSHTYAWFIKKGIE